MPEVLEGKETAPVRRDPWWQGWYCYKWKVGIKTRILGIYPAIKTQSLCILLARRTMSDAEKRRAQNNSQEKYHHDSKHLGQ